MSRGRRDKCWISSRPAAEYSAGAKSVRARYGWVQVEWAILVLIMCEFRCLTVANWMGLERDRMPAGGHRMSLHFTGHGKLLKRHQGRDTDREECAVSRSERQVSQQDVTHLLTTLRSTFVSRKSFCQVVQNSFVLLAVFLCPKFCQTLPAPSSSCCLA